MKLTETGKPTIFIPVIILIMLFVAAGSAGAENLSLTAELDNSEIWLGDSVQLTLFLQGSEEAIAPPLDIPGVRIEQLGGTVRSSRSITNINGRVTEDVRKAYVFGYRLTPGTAGQITIPSIQVVVEGTLLKTRPLSLNVRQPQFSDDFRLELDFDRNRVYLNEECRLKVSFFYSKSLRTLDISIPELANLEYEGEPATSSSEQYEININGSPVVFSRDDRNVFAGLSAVLVLRPDTAGKLSLRNASASFESVTGYQRVQDFFGRIQNQEVYGRNVIPGTTAMLEVSPFPEDNKPEDFFGLSGDISIKIEVEPDKVHIGDPITLTLEVSGMNNPEIVIPPLERFFDYGIDIPDTRASASISGNTKTIRQTVRINDASVKSIPEIRFSYFNTDTESYQYAVADAVPLTVLDTKIVTSAELEGDEQSGADAGKVILERKREGIYHNYTGKELLVSEKPGAAGALNRIIVTVLLMIPPAAFIVLMIITIILPQIRAGAAARADRGRALHGLKKIFGKSHPDDPIIFLKGFNRKLTEFLNRYGSAEDEESIAEALEKMNAVLYGKGSIDSESSMQIVKTILKLLDKKGADNETRR